MAEPINESRYQSLAEFWPYYLSEHRVPGDRVMHFIGTSWFFICLLAAILFVPERILPALAAVGAIGWYASTFVERKRPAFAEVIVLFAILVVAAPLLMLVGIGGAYFLAWCGHFGIEHNKPAAFRYPVWSFISDFQVWGMMATGRLWVGDTMKETPIVDAKTAA